MKAAQLVVAVAVLAEAGVLARLARPLQQLTVEIWNNQ
jgi:hypothetical protein